MFGKRWKEEEGGCDARRIFRNVQYVLYVQYVLTRLSRLTAQR